MSVRIKIDTSSFLLFLPAQNILTNGNNWKLSCDQVTRCSRQYRMQVSVEQHGRTTQLYLFHPVLLSTCNWRQTERQSQLLDSRDLSVSRQDELS